MSNFTTWGDFFEAKEKVNANVPPQGKGAAPYHAPHAKNDGGVKLRVADKDKTTPLGDEATPSLKDPKHNHPLGVKPSGSKTVKESYKSGEYDGKVRVRVAEKNKTKPLGDEATPSLKSPKHNLPDGKKPSNKGVTTENFLRQTENMTDTEFIKSMLGGMDWDKDDGDEEESHHDDDDDDDHSPKEDDEDESELPPMHCQFSGHKVIPSAFEVARYMAHMLPHNKRAIRLFVHELKNVPSAMGSLMGEMVRHNQLYDEMTNQIGLGETKVARKFVKSMQDNHNNFVSEMGLSLEAVSPAMGDRLRSHRKPNRDDNPNRDDQSSEIPPDADAMATNQMADKGVDSLMSDPPGDGTDSVDTVGNTRQQPLPSPMAQNMKKEFAYHHMIKEMSKFDNMSKAMNEILGY